MPTVVATRENFESLINDNDTVVVDFWAPWCGPCRGFAPVFEAAADKYPDAVFAKVNTDEQQDLAGAFQIRSIPTLMVFRQRILVFAQPGALPGSALDSILDKAKQLDMDQVRREIAARETTSPESAGPAAN